MKSHMQTLFAKSRERYVILAFLAVCQIAQAQTMKYSCPNFFKDWHQTLDCGEAVFSEPPLHLTISSVPPSNGFAIGAVLEQQIHDVSPFAASPLPALRTGSAPPPASP